MDYYWSSKYPKNKIELKSLPLKVLAVTKKSSAEVLKNAIIGDVLILSTSLEHQGGASSGCYSAKITVTLQRTGERSEKAMTIMLKALQNFELEEMVME